MPFDSHGSGVFAILKLASHYVAGKEPAEEVIERVDASAAISTQVEGDVRKRLHFPSLVLQV